MKNVILFTLVLLIGCNLKTSYKVHQVQLIELGEISNPDMQISGLDWYNDNLVLIPQIPQKDEAGHIIYSINKDNISDYIGKPTNTIEIKKGHIITNGLENLIQKIEWEGIAFYKNEAFLLIENDQDSMMAFIVKGHVDDSMEIIVDTASLTQIPLHFNIHEMACEALTIFNDRIIVFYEVNGTNINNTPHVFTYDFNLNFLGFSTMPNIEYRISDATREDNGRFWIINSFWPDDEHRLLPSEEDFFPSTTKDRSKGVKRLIELSYTNNIVSVNDKNTIMLDPAVWNWEGLVRFGDNGFLIINDTYAPVSNKTWLGYINPYE